MWNSKSQNYPSMYFMFEPFQHKTRNISLLPAQTVSAKQGPLPGQVAVYLTLYTSTVLGICTNNPNKPSIIGDIGLR